MHALHLRWHLLLHEQRPLQELQHGAHGAGQHAAGAGAGQQDPSGPWVAQPVTNNAAAVTAKARPVFFIVIYPLDKIDGKVSIFFVAHNVR